MNIGHGLGTRAAASSTLTSSGVRISGSIGGRSASLSGAGKSTTWVLPAGRPASKEPRSVFLKPLKLRADGGRGPTHLALDLHERESFGVLRHGVASEVTGGVGVGWRRGRRQGVARGSSAGARGRAARACGRVGEVRRREGGVRAAEAGRPAAGGRGTRRTESRSLAIASSV